MHESVRTAVPSGPIAIAPRIWWVGCYLPGDAFQCHSYLIEHGDQSVLIDPGSMLTWDEVSRKVEAVVGLHNVRYFVCHHADPDIAASLPEIEQRVTRGDAAVVTHWRGEALLKHYALKLPYWRIEENGWFLDLGGRKLQFLATPYCHFPGAFATFDETSGTLFSSDLFGGFTEEWTLYANDERYFEQMRPCHEHNMPSRQILGFTLERLRRLPLRLIAPQHGSLIPERLIPFIIDSLAGLDCGLYLLSDETSDIRRLSKLQASLHDVAETLMFCRDFNDIVGHLKEILGRYVPVTSIEFFATIGEGQALALLSERSYRGTRIALPPALHASLEGRHSSPGANPSVTPGTWPLDVADGDRALFVPLRSQSDGQPHGVAVIRLQSPVSLTLELKRLAAEMSLPLHVAVEREMLNHSRELEREAIYQLAIRDPLTRLFTRWYMDDQLQRLFALQDRGASGTVSLTMFDIDAFKTVNDRFGHPNGDRVLEAVSALLLSSTREADVAVRLGGDELGLFTVGCDLHKGLAIAERIRSAVHDLSLPELEGVRVSVSAGLAVRKRRESAESLFARADRALYQAKSRGRNRVCSSE
jgi:diguanylate cyclase (GGDEF)-like protein